MNFKIDAKVGVDNSGQIDYIEICNTKTSNLYVYDVSVDKNVNQPDDANFTMLKDCPGFNQLYVLGTAIRISVENPQGTAWLPIFVGRVLSISTDFMFRQTVRCDGALSWFGDIIVRPKLWYVGRAVWVEDETKPGGGYTTTRYVQTNVVASEMMGYIQDCYNARRSSERRISFGSISTNLIYSNDGTAEHPRYFFDGVKDYKTALDWVNEIANLDSTTLYYAVPANDGWDAVINFDSTMDTFGTSGLPSVSYAQNLIDMQMDQDSSGIFTSVIALGKDKLRMNDWYYPDPSDPSRREQGYELDHVDNGAGGYYGNIEKVENFDGKAGVELYNAAYDYAYTIWNTFTQGLQVEAIDPIWQNGRLLQLGDHVALSDVIHMGQARETMECIVTATHIDLDRPGSSSYTFFPCGAIFKKTTAKPLSTLIAEGAGEGISKAEYMTEQQAESYNVLGDNTVVANFSDGRSDLYQLIEDPENEGKYMYQKLVGGSVEE